MLGDFCLDRYLEIDPARAETSLETGLGVFNVVRVRAQPGGAGTVLNNLVALGVGRIISLGFAGEDGEGFELIRAMQSDAGRVAWTASCRRRSAARLPIASRWWSSPASRRGNSIAWTRKNWTPTPAEVERQLIAAVCAGGRARSMPW